MEVSSILKGATFIFDTTIQTSVSGVIGFIYGAVVAPPHNRRLAAKVWAVTAMFFCLFFKMTWQITGCPEGNKKLFLALNFTAAALFETAVLIGYKYETITGLAASILATWCGLRVLLDLKLNQF